MDIPGRKYFQDEEVYSDWFPRQGDDMILRVELIDYTPSTSLDVVFTVYSKNTEDTGDGTLVNPSSPSIPSVTMSEQGSTPDQADLIETIYIESGTTPATGLGELVRVRAAAVAETGNVGEWLLIRLHPPIFVNRARG